MKIDDILAIIASVAKENGIAKPYVVGGVPRDRIIGVIGKNSKIKDIDLTTGDKDALRLSQLVEKRLEGSIYHTYDDGHSSVDYLGVHFDFSSNFNAPGVKEELIKNGVQNIDSMKLEIYSRDFTINTLLETLDFTAIYDITKEAIDDIKAGIIRCPINPKIAIGSDPRRILRAIRFAVKYGFKIENDLKNTMLEYRKLIQKLPVKNLQDKINEIVIMDADKGIDMLIEYKLLPLVPLTKTLSDILIQQRKLIRAL